MTSKPCVAGQGQCGTCDEDFFLCESNDGSTTGPCAGRAHGQVTTAGYGYCLETKCRCYMQVVDDTFGDIEIDIGIAEVGRSCGAHG